MIVKGGQLRETSGWGEGKKEVMGVNMIKIIYMHENSTMKHIKSC
jgi:hypothetical protein